MPRKKPSKIKVQFEKHATIRWLERVGRPPGKLDRLIRELLIDQIQVGLIVDKGQVYILLSAQDFDLPQDMIACIDLPTVHGVWRVITFKPKGG